MRCTAFPRRSIVVPCAAVLAATCAAFGQATERTLFVANNGNAEGSVTSFTVNPDGTLAFVQKLVTGVSNTSTADGTNAYAISVSPNGRFLAVSHATADDVNEEITLIEVNADATMQIVARAFTPDSPLDLEWVSDTVLAVMRTNLSAINQVITYRFDPVALTLAEVARVDTGEFCAYLSVHPNREFLYVGDSDGFAVTAVRVLPDGSLEFIQRLSTATYPLGHGITPDGTKLYAGGGIHNDRHRVLGIDIDPATGAMSTMAGSTFTSAGNAPKQCIATPDGEYLLVAHGTDATVRSFTVNQGTGDLTATGFLYDVGGQGAHGDMLFLGGNLYVTNKWDSPYGVRQLRVNPDGSFTELAPQISTQGVWPTYMAAWEPSACPADFDGDGTLSVADFTAFRAAYLAGDMRADFSGNGTLDVPDFTAFRAAYLAGCP